MPHIFISYARENSDFVNLLREKFADWGLTPWIDSQDMVGGKYWWKQIEVAINNAFGLVLVMSHDAFISPFVSYEWAYARGRNLPIIPVLVKSTDAIPSILLDLQYIDFVNEEERWDDLKKALLELDQNTGTSRPWVSEKAPPTIQKAADQINENLDINVQEESIALLVEQAEHPAALDALAYVVFNHPMPSTRTKCLKALLGIGTETALKYLESSSLINDITAALNDAANDIQIRRNALTLLFAIKPPNLWDKMVSYLGSENEVLRSEAIHQFALWDGDEILAKQLLQLLNKHYPQGYHSSNTSFDEKRRFIDGIEAVLLPKLETIFTYLLEHINHSNDDVRRLVVGVLSKSERNEIGIPLREALTDAVPYVRAAAVAGFARTYGQEALDTLIKMLDDDSSAVRISVINALGATKLPQALEPLRNLLSDGNSQVGYALVNALSQIPDSRAISAIIQLATHHEGYVGTHAYFALSKLGITAIPTIVERLSEIALEDATPEKTILAKLLSEHGDASSCDLLYRLLDDKNLQVKASAIGGLGRLKDKRLVDVSYKYIQSGAVELRCAIASAFGNVDDSRVIDYLLLLLEDGDHQVRYHATHALGKYKDCGVVSRLGDVIRKTGKDKSNLLYTLRSYDCSETVEVAIGLYEAKVIEYFDFDQLIRYLKSPEAKVARRRFGIN